MRCIILARPRAAGGRLPRVPAQAGTKGETTVEDLSRLQVVARRMAECKATVPDFAISVDVVPGPSRPPAGAGAPHAGAGPAGA